MVGEPVVDEDRLAGRAEEDVRRLHVEVHDVLAVEVVERVGDLRADAGDLVVREREPLEAGEEGPARDPLHDDVGLDREVAVARRNGGRGGPDSRGRIICSISKLTIAAGSIPSSSFGTFISTGKSTSGRVTTRSVDIPPSWISSPTSNPSSVHPALDPRDDHAAHLPREALGEELREAGLQDLRRRPLDVVGGPRNVISFVAGVEDGPRRGGVAVPRLADGAEDGEPPPLPHQRDPDAGDGPEGVAFHISETLFHISDML